MITPMLLSPRAILVHAKTTTEEREVNYFDQQELKAIKINLATFDNNLLVYLLLLN